MTRKSREHAAASVREPAVASDPAEAIDQAMQTLFVCALTLYRASRAVESHKNELIDSAIVGLDASIRALRDTASAL